MDAPAGSRLVVIAGGAGGVGRATAQAFAEAGFSVIVLDRREEPVAGELRLVDLADEQTLRAAVADITTLDHLLVIAGGMVDDEMGKAATDITPAVLRQSLEANLVIAQICIAVLLPALRAGAGDRSITLTSSINARVAAMRAHAYSAAKAAIESFARTLAAELGGDRIRVNAIAFGTITTPRLREHHRDGDESLDRLSRSALSGRLVSPDEAARAYLALARDLTAVTGTTLVVDGGQSVSFKP
jgi:3-oxoacyl-[acyl-carrier protein] reductase